jgi:AraC-like DNA-binding protein
MLKTTNKYAETSDYRINVDVFSEVLNALQVNGSVLVCEDYLSPWGISIPKAETLKKLLNLNAGQAVIPFHYVKRGYLDITLEDGKTYTLESGDMAICFAGHAHKLAQGNVKKWLSVESLLAGGVNPFQPDFKDKARSASLLCGVFMMRNIECNPLFSSLPSFLHLSAENIIKLNNLPAVLQWMSREVEQKILGNRYVIERLLEILCAEVCRSHLEATSNSGWFAALKDPMVGRALAMMHSQPDIVWTVNRLANDLAISPSRFAARFTLATGESPMAYLTQWRMNLAGRLLKESQLSISEVAARVSYENVAAFTRTFKRHLGLPPASWRVKQI